MRYIGLAEFMRMPSGTLYMVEKNPKEPLYGFDFGISIKGENVGTNDWWEQDLLNFDWGDTEEFIGKIDAAIKHGADLPLEHGAETRYGEYPEEGDLMFWVLTPTDMEQLIDNLQSFDRAAWQARAKRLQST